MKLSIVMPVFNEAATLSVVVQRVQAAPLEKEILIVNDASSDGTPAVLANLSGPGVKIIHHAANRGKGAAICSGLREASGDVVVIQDADLEYDPNDFSSMVVLIAAGQAEVVYGVRSLKSQRPLMRWGNHLMTMATNVLYGARLKDMETCYKMMRREIALRLHLECQRFDVEAEITAKLLRAGYVIYELPIHYQARYENKKLSPLDGLPTMRALLKYRNWTMRP